MNQSGILVLDKPAGISSAAALSQAKKKLKIEKIGHSGTLDPMATGVLVALCGKATRLAAYAESGMKTYSGTILFGRETSTDDIEGETLRSCEAQISQEQIDGLLKDFCGEIEQTPPQISAVKVSGKPAYKRARDGEHVELKSRRVTVSRFEAHVISANSISFVIDCGPGTYIRSIARDMGARLGCGGCLSSLRREASYPFTVAMSSTLETLAEDKILPWTVLFPNAEAVQIEPQVSKRLNQGDIVALQILSQQLEGLGFGAGQESALVKLECQNEAVRLLAKNQGQWQFGVGFNLE